MKCFFPQKNMKWALLLASQECIRVCQIPIAPGIRLALKASPFHISSVLQRVSKSVCSCSNVRNNRFLSSRTLRTVLLLLERDANAKRNFANQMNYNSRAPRKQPFFTTALHDAGRRYSRTAYMDNRDSRQRRV